MNRRESFNKRVISIQKEIPTNVPEEFKGSISELNDNEIDTSDIPEWTEENWARAKKGLIHRTGS